MSKTRHHRNQKRQHTGHDLWSRRPCLGMCYNAENKKLTRQIERANSREEVFNLTKVEENNEL